MKAYVKVILAILVVAVVGLTAGLIVVVMNKDDKPDILGIDILLNDNHLVDISEGESEEKLYSVNLNATDTFSLKYVAKPLDLESYLIMVTSSNDAITVNTGSNVQGEQTGVADFTINNLTNNNVPVTITFKALSNKNDTLVESSIKVLITQPSTLKSVEDIKYDGSKITWSAVKSNTDNISVNSGNIKYKVNLQYLDNGEEKSIVHTTSPNECEFKLENMAGGFKTGVVNSITVQALGDNTITSDSVVSDAYKFYVLPSPTYTMTEKDLSISNIDENASAVVLYKYVDGAVSKFQYRQKSEASSWNVSSIEGSDKDYELAMYSTVIGSSSDYHNEVNSKEVDGVHYFDSPKSEVCSVVLLDTPTITISNNETANVFVNNTNVETYDSTKISWNHVTNNLQVRSKVKYLVTITNGSNKYTQIVDYNTLGGITIEPYLSITKELLEKCKMFSETLNEFEIRVDAFVPASAGDVNGEEQNILYGGMIAIDSTGDITNTVTLKEYIPYSTDFKINIVDSLLTYEIPTTDVSKKLIYEISFIFVTKDGKNKQVITRTSTDTIDLANEISLNGDYDMFVVFKGDDGVVNNLSLDAYKIESCYKTIGAVTNAKLNDKGVLTFDSVADAVSYSIEVKIDTNTYSTSITDISSGFNLISFLNTQVDGGYSSVASNYGVDKESYKVIVTSISDKSGWIGAENLVEFYKFSAVSSIQESKEDIYTLADDKITWGSVAGATAYKLQANDESTINITNGENFYSYKGTTIDEDLVVGDNKISISVLGTIIDGVTILPSNPTSKIINKLTSSNNLAITSDILTWNGNDNGVYFIKIMTLQDALKWEGYVENNDGKANALSLTTLGLQNNQTYKISIKQVLNNYFDSDYSQEIFVKKLPVNPLAVIENSGKYYIVWEEVNLSSNMVYVNNSTSDVEIKSGEGDLEGYSVIDLDEVTLNNSLGLKAVGTYEFQSRLGSSTGYTLENNKTAENPAYISSDVARLTIIRIDVPTLTTSGYSINLLGSNDVSGFDIIISKDTETIDTKTLVSNNATYNTKDILDESGSYSIDAISKGNITSIFDTSLISYVLNSDTLTLEVIKLSPVAIEVIEDEYKNKITFASLGIDNVKYQIFAKYNEIDGYKLLEETKDYTLTLVNDSYLVDLVNNNSGSYYVVAVDNDENVLYLSSDSSQVVEIKYVNFENTVEFVSEDLISWKDTYAFSQLVSTKHYVTISGGTTDIVYTITNTGNISKVTVSGISELTQDITSKYTDFGLNYDSTNKLYKLDLSYLKSIGKLAENKTYSISLDSVGNVTNDTSLVVYNNSASSSDISITYYAGYNTATIDDKLIIAFSDVAKDYTTLILNLTDSLDVAEEFVISLTSSGDVTGDNDTKLTYVISDNKITLDLASISAGSYEASWKFNKVGRLGLVSATSNVLEFEKISDFDSSTETLSLEEGKLFINGATSTREYVIYSVDSTGKVISILGAYHLSGGEERIAIDTSKWIWAQDSNQLFVKIQISETNKIISDLSKTYTMTKLVTSEISVTLDYEDDTRLFNLQNYIVEWNGANLLGYVDLANGYIIKLSGAVTDEKIFVEANTSGSVGESGKYSVAYVNGKYTLTLSASTIGLLLDKTKNLSIELIEVVGGEVESVTDLTTNYVSNFATSEKTVSYLPTSSEITIADGVIKLGKYTYGATSALINFYKLVDGVYSQEVSYYTSLTKSELESGATIDLSDITLASGTYKIAISYIGNNKDIVSSETYYKEGITKSSTATIEVIDGKLKISNSSQKTGTVYEYKVILNGEEYLSSSFEVTEINTICYIDSNTLPQGAFILEVRVINPNEIISEVVTKNLYKHKIITDLTKVIIYTSNSQQKLQLKFTAQNLESGLDRVEYYRIIFQDMLDSTKTLTRDVEASGISNGVYTFEIEDLSTTILGSLSNQITVSVVALGNGTYIENLAQVEGDNVVEVVKLYSPNEHSISFVEGNMVIDTYNHVTGNTTSFVPDSVALTFTQGENVYTYTLSGFDMLEESKTVDFTVESVFDGESWVILPSGSYTINLQYVSSSEEIIDSAVGFYSKGKAVQISKITIDTTNYSNDTILLGSDSTAVYNYMIYKDRELVLEGCNNGENNNNKIIFDNLELEPDTYTIRVQIIDNSGLKSDYSEEFDFVKLSPVILTASVVKTTSEYYIQVKFSVPENNLNSTNDLATYYNLTLNNKLRYNFEANKDSSVYATNGGTDSIIYVTYLSGVYTIKIPITEVTLLTESGENGIISSSDAGYVTIGGIGNVITELNIAITRIIGNATDKILSNDTANVATCKITLAKIQTSGTTIEMVHGILNYSDTNNLDKLSTKVYFYKVIEEGVYSIEPAYVWEIATSEETLDITDIVSDFESGNYLVAIKHFGNYETNVIDSDTLYIVNSSKNIVRALESPKLYIEDGEIKWTKVEVENTETRYELTIYNSLGEIVSVTNNGSITNDFLDTSTFAPDTYTISIRAIANGCIKSKISEVFTATKLDSPNVYDVDNSQSQLVKEDRAIKLNWSPISNASGYIVNDYVSIDNIKKHEVSLLVDEEETSVYEFVINLDTSIGKHYYYVVSKGSDSTIAEIDSVITYASSGYLSSYNSYDNANQAKVTSADIIINTASNIYVNEGIVNWAKVDNVDYYKLIITACDESGNVIKEYVTSTQETYFDISKLSDMDITTAPILKFAVENKTTTSDYIVVSTTADRPLETIILFNNLTELLYSDLGIDNGMIRYKIASSNVDDFVALINANRAESVEALTCNISNLFDEDSILSAYVTPVLTINGVDFRLGEEITNHIFMVDGTQYSYSTWDKVIDASVSTIEVYIPLPSTLPMGNYKITLRGLGNTTTETEEVAVINSIASSAIEGYKLGKPKTPFIDGTKHNIVDGVLKFTPSATLETNKHIMVYQLSFTSKKEGVDSQSAQIFVTTNKDDLYTEVISGFDYYYSGYLDTVNNIISVDIYNLFVQHNVKVSGGTDLMFEDFVPLQHNTDYYASVRAVAILLGTNSGGVSFTDDYFNSNSSSLVSTFNVFTAPELYLEEEAINWSIAEGVSEYEVYFYSYNPQTAETSEEAVYFERITEIPDNVNFAYTNFRNNPELEAGVYSIKVVAVGNGSNKLSSRLSDSVEFIVQKLDPVEIIVNEGVYTWTNSTQLISKNGDRVISTSIPYLYYLVKIYASNKEFDKTQDVVIIENKAGATTTIFELPEKYPSKDSNGDFIEYQIVVYAYTNIAYNTYLLPSDDSIDECRTRSSEVSGNDTGIVFRIDTDGQISWNDTNNNNYIAFIFDESGTLVFVSKHLTSKQLNIYVLYDSNNNKFDISTGNYSIKLKAIDKEDFTDNFVGDLNTYNAILRSVYTYSIDFKTILQPQFVITEGEISWKTNFDSLGQELAMTRIIINGEFNVAGKIENTSVWIELDEYTTEFKLQTILTSEVLINNNTVSHYIYPAGEDNNKYVSFIEGNTYDISIRFIGSENINIEEGTTTKLISSKESIGKIELLNNPKAPVNPTKYEQSTDTTELEIYNNIPKLIQYNNYIYWDYTTSTSSTIYNYNIEVFARTKNADATQVISSTLLYQYNLRNLDKTNYLISLYDMVDKVYLDIERDCVSASGVGIYLAIDKVLNLIVSGSFDFGTTDICVYVEAVGDTVETPINSDTTTHCVTHHYSDETKLALEDNIYVMAIALPAIPEGLAYDGAGVISWNMADKVSYQLAVAYEKTAKTIESYNYDNIKQRIKVTNTSIVEVDSEGKETSNIYADKTVILTLLNLTENEYTILFNFSVDANKVYFIDVISVPSDTASYNLKYLTNNIRAIAIRAIGVMDADDLVNNTFVSNPATIKYTKDTSIVFDKFDSGDGSESYPFVINSITALPETYLEEYCYYEIVPNGRTEETAYNQIDYISDWNTLGLVGDKTFNGILDGNNVNYVVSYNKVTSGTPYIALFNRIGKLAQILNLNITVNHEINYSKTYDERNYIFNISSTEGYFATVAIYNKGLIANVNVSGYIATRSSSLTQDSHIGGIVVFNEGTIAYCNVSANLDIASQGKNRIGGISVYNGNLSGVGGTITTCMYSGVTYASGFVGGIVDTMYCGTIYNCTNSSYIVRKDSSLTYGGIVRLISNYSSIQSQSYEVNISQCTIEIGYMYLGTSASNSSVTIGDYTYTLSTTSSTTNFGGIYYSGGSLGASNKVVISISNCTVWVKDIKTVSSATNYLYVLASSLTSSSLSSTKVVSFSNIKYNNTNLTTLANGASSVSGVVATSSDINNEWYKGNNKSVYGTILDGYGYVFADGRVSKKTE